MTATKERAQTDREQYIKSLTTFLRDTGKKPVAELIDSIYEDAVAALAWDERTHELREEFVSTRDSIGELLRSAPGVSDELANQVVWDLEKNWTSLVEHIAGMMINSTADFFISVQIVPLLKELTAFLEERGGVTRSG